MSHLMRSGNVVPLLYPFDLDGVFDDCPYDVINDHLRCFDEKVVGVSVMMPIFRMVLWISTLVNMDQVF